VDLIYGLPFQSAVSFRRSLESVLETSPDRLSVFNYAHLPERFKPQRRIEETDLPSPAEKLEILKMTSEVLAGAGYVYIGMDHFARPDDELARAQRDGTLYRNFQGYSTHADCDLVGFGVTSIGMVGNTYAQNQRTLDTYYECIDAGDLAVFRGLELSRDDLIRRDVITRLICHFSLDFDALDTSWGVVFSDYFADELKRLNALAEDELVTLRPGGIDVLPKGRLLIRNICMVFDAYLGHELEGQRYSRVI
jgi:oxygen-independent coproporphyrinogen-3 oxidase